MVDKLITIIWATVYNIILNKLNYNRQPTLIEVFKLVIIEVKYKILTLVKSSYHPM